MLIKPVMAIIALILESQHVYNEGQLDLKSGYMYVAFINNVSVSVRDLFIDRTTSIEIIDFFVLFGFVLFGNTR